MIVLGVAFFVFLLLGVPIAFVFGISAVLAVVIADLPLVLVAHRFYAGLNDFTLMAIPFFLLAGMLMDSGGLSRRIIDFAGALVGWVTGSLLMVAVVGATAIAAMSTPRCMLRARPSTRSTPRRWSTTTRWSRTQPSPPGTTTT